MNKSPPDDNGQLATLPGWCILIYPFLTRHRTYVLHRSCKTTNRTLGPWTNKHTHITCVQDMQEQERNKNNFNMTFGFFIAPNDYTCSLVNEHRRWPSAKLLHGMQISLSGFCASRHLSYKACLHLLLTQLQSLPAVPFRAWYRLVDYFSK